MCFHASLLLISSNCASHLCSPIRLLEVLKTVSGDNYITNSCRTHINVFMQGTQQVIRATTIRKNQLANPVVQRCLDCC